MKSHSSDRVVGPNDLIERFLQRLQVIYSIFSVYPRKPFLEGCPHCLGKEARFHPHRAPLRELTADDLGGFAEKAMTTWGDSADYRHFLPRIVELSLTEGRHPGLEPWHIGSKLAYANWSQWPGRERDCLIRFMRSAWHAVIAFPPDSPSSLSTGPVQWSVVEALSLQANAQGDIGPLLEIWRSSTDIAAQLHLSTLARDSADHLAKERDFPFAQFESPAAREQLRNWMMEPALVSGLMEAFENELDGPWSSLLAEGIDSLEWIQMIGAQS